MLGFTYCSCLFLPPNCARGGPGHLCTGFQLEAYSTELNVTLAVRTAVSYRLDFRIFPTVLLYVTSHSNGQVFNAVNLGQILMIAVIASAIWWQSDNVGDIAGTMFFVSMQQSVIGINVSASFWSWRVFPVESGFWKGRREGSRQAGRQAGVCVLLC